LTCLLAPTKMCAKCWITHPFSASPFPHSWFIEKHDAGGMGVVYQAEHLILARHGGGK
jgi:hypothetical protein